MRRDTGAAWLVVPPQISRLTTAIDKTIDKSADESGFEFAIGMLIAEE